MAGGSTSDFFAFLDKQNNAIAARESEGKTEFEFGMDQARVRRDAERREKADGQLGARARLRNRPRSTSIVRGYMEQPTGD